MNVVDLAVMLLSLDEKSEMQTSIELLKESNFSAFYENNQDIVQSILFIETLDDFLDFSSENLLDVECYCAAFLCAKGYGILAPGRSPGRSPW